MTHTVHRRKAVRLPLTFRSVADFAAAPFGRLFAIEWVFALFAAASLVCFFTVAWQPAVQDVVGHLPEQGCIRDGRWEWRPQPGTGASSENNPETSRAGSWAGNSFLAIHPSSTGTAADTPQADLLLGLEESTWSIRTSFICLTMPYPRHGRIPLNRPALESFMGKYGATIPVLAGLASIPALMLGWALVGGVYTLVLRLAGWKPFLRLGGAGGWRLASAALMPGSLWMSAAIVLYGCNVLSHGLYLWAFWLHFPIGWTYVYCAAKQPPADCG